MKKLILLNVFVLSMAFQVQAETIVKSCQADDGKFSVTINQQPNNEGYHDLIIKSNNPDRPAERSFPTSEIKNENIVKYHLLASDFELLVVDLTTGQGKLSNGQFMSPNPNIAVTCQ